jgi:Fe2+ or Zn2+ uptake regulation protein
MLAHDKGQVESIATAILEHLKTHPLGADTAEGVARWWLGQADPPVSLELVESALEVLEARHAVRRVELVDGTVLYSSAPIDRH